MDEGKLDKIMHYLEELNKRVTHIEEDLSSKEITAPQTEAPMNSEIEESFMEFFLKYNPEKETDKTLVIMHFLESRRHMQNITSKNISEGFKEIREKIPTNVADKIQMLHKKGLIMPSENVENLKGWLITRTGLEYLQNLKNGN